MIPAIDENYTIKLKPTIPNSEFLSSDEEIIVKCRPASNLEKKEYRIQQGVVGSEESVYIYCSNLTAPIKVGDRLEFLGQRKVVTSVGYYYDKNLFINPSAFDPEYIISKCPKGITLQ